MTRLIKSGDPSEQKVTAVRSAGSVNEKSGVRTYVSPETEALQAQASDLAGKLEETAGQITRLRSDVERAYREGKAEGRLEGLAAAEERDGKMLAALEAGLTKAQATFSRDLSAMQALAAALAQASLDKILGNLSQYAELLEPVLRHQLDQVEDHSVVHVEVSTEDFGDEAKLAKLSAAVGQPNLSLGAVSSLKSGECRMKLQLGKLEVGVGQQWRNLSQMLDELSGAGAAR